MESENDLNPRTIKSNTIIKYDSNSSNRSKFSQLSFETNLKTPPDNWLCGRFGDYNWSYPLQKNNSSMLSSFRMANNFPECVGSVDVIADAENIKKLLLMPFDSGHISLMVHRIGNSLLIDDFDLANHLINNKDNQWSWLKRFIDNMIVRDNSKSYICKKAITRSELQKKNMLCKFLHYSIDQNECENETQNEDNFSLSPKRKSNNDNNSCDDNEDNNKDNNKENNAENKEFYFSFYNKESHMSEMVERHLNRIEDNFGFHFDGFLRNVLWTFEDIRMLVSSKMPIFGDANHPAVSLRLIDMKRPINVLTGLDYWLDNLMCSVPEVVMCYHLDGIVQKYELIKTEDIPQISSNKSQLFSPKVIRNIAQNILSFLKSKATKSGHTYWLFKGKHDDVVKLYDLTALCVDYMEDDTNPFTIPVAMLLYRVAKNMRDSNQSHSSAVNLKIHKLLTNCLSLLDPKKHSQIISSANYLLSDIYVPNDIDPTLLPLNDKSNEEEEEEDDFDEFDGRNSPLSNESSDESYCPTLEVNKLSHPHYYVNKKYPKQTKPKNLFLEENKMDWNIKCENALKHIIEGLKTLFHTNEEKDTIYQTSEPYESQKMANPYIAIPLDYSSLDSNEDKNEDKNEELKTDKQMTQKKPNETIPNWKTCLEVCLLQKGAQVYCILAELSNTKANCLKALKYIRMGIMCYEIALIIMENSGQTNYLKEPIACLLALCGDIHFKILNNTKNDCENDCNSNTNNYNDSYYLQLIQLFEKLCETELKEEYRWAYNPVINSENNIEERLKLCYRCYEEALFQLKDTKHSNSFITENSLLERIKKRLGYICNELANYYMNQSLEHFNKIESLNESEVNKLDSLTNKSFTYFQSAVELFKEVKDKLNVSLMLSNTGRLMRTKAHIFAPHFRQNNSSNEFSTKEKHFYIKAIEYYSEALKQLGVEAESVYMNAWDNINWELCSTQFVMGCLLQDFAPLSMSAFEVIETEIAKYFMQALSLCENAEKWDTSRHVLYQYRFATICHRLASLYHNSYRNMSEENQKKKIIYNLSNDYYEKSILMYKKLNDNEELLRVTLEQIGLHERNLSQLNGYSSKLKALNLIIHILLTISQIDFNDSETNDEKQIIENLLQLFEARMSFCVKGLIKCLSTKVSKNKELIKKWKDIDEYMSNSISSKEMSVIKRIETFCNRINSSKLLT